MRSLTSYPQPILHLASLTTYTAPQGVSTGPRWTSASGEDDLHIRNPIEVASDAFDASGFAHPEPYNGFGSTGEGEERQKSPESVSSSEYSLTSAANSTQECTVPNRAPSQEPNKAAPSNADTPSGICENGPVRPLNPLPLPPTRQLSLTCILTSRKDGSSQQRIGTSPRSSNDAR
ncbi:hypothetical protein K469DRAFT_698111 [Zopfia rhizophila CBS 207.26]|uniref:Uncharacterized protein n=1 Tax=Zopfia rhizophila CBS 207.26 TaxID=1314779 RepID=A0A6A6DFU0_9PEZI|nr:hypothetical protein K469DRAFT_698111 [Zopfia rhizophila CBS 207.26]